MDEIKERKSEDTKMKESLRKLADSIGAEADDRREARTRGSEDVAPGPENAVAPDL